MEDFILLDWGRFTLFLLILMRMSAFIVLNPLFGRAGVPQIFQAGMAISMSVIVLGLEDGSFAMPGSNLELMLMMLAEVMLGGIFALVIQFFFTVPVIGGGLIDTQMGFGMAQNYDPGMQMQMSVNASLLNVLAMVIFFASDCHLVLLRIMMTSGKMVPFGGYWLSEDFFQLTLTLFTQCFMLGIRLVMPILAAELLGQVGMGVLMKAIPQINVFVINIDLKVIIGLVLMMTFMPLMSEFLYDMELTMLTELQSLLLVIGRN